MRLELIYIVCHVVIIVINYNFNVIVMFDILLHYV